MKRDTFTIIFMVVVIFGLLLNFSSCKNLTDLNENPNEVTGVTDDYFLSSVLTGIVSLYQNQTYTDTEILCAVQYLQQDWLGADKISFNWDSYGWDDYYHVLETNESLLKQSNDEGDEGQFYLAAALISKAFLSGFMTDQWGDLPYTEALQGDEDLYYPVFDTQEDIYSNILSLLDSANVLLSGSDYTVGDESYDVIYNGDPEKWRKFANSLSLRYYMRLSAKLPETARTGVEKILSDPEQYPVFSGIDDIAQVSYEGTSGADSWPGGDYNWPEEKQFKIRKPCKTLVDTLREFNDPRLPVWINPVEIQIVVEDPANATYTDEDITVGDKRYIHSDYADLIEYEKEVGPVDPNQYVGLSPNLSDARFYNLYTTSQQGDNPHISYLADMYRENSNSQVKAVFMSYAEVCFIAAEAALRGWSAGNTAEEYYNRGVAASLGQYGQSSYSSSYLQQEKVSYNGTLKQIMTQKWLALWMSPEIWFDYRRTGLPDFQFGSGAIHPAMPVRLIYPEDEKLNNETNYTEAVEHLEQTDYSDGMHDSQYSKMWLIRGTENPW